MQPSWNFKTTEFVKGTSLETIESQTQQELLYKNVENCAENRRSEPALGEDQARATIKVVAGGFRPGLRLNRCWPCGMKIRQVRPVKVQRTNSDGFGGHQFCH